MTSRCCGPARPGPARRRRGVTSGDPATGQRRPGRRATGCRDRLRMAGSGHALSPDQLTVCAHLRCTPRKLSPPLHGLTIGQQPLGDVPADAAAPLDRLRAVPELAARGQHRLATVPAGAEPALRRDLLPAAGHLDRAWPGAGREPGQHVAGGRMSASPRAHHQLLLSCGPADATAPPATARSGVHFRRARSRRPLRQQPSQAAGEGRQDPGACGGLGAFRVFSPGCIMAAVQALQRLPRLGTVSPPALPAARRLGAKAPRGCCGQRRSPHRFTGARIVTIILISGQASCEVGIRGE